MTAVSDNFQRANGALGANWSNWSWSGAVAAKISSNAAVGGGTATTSGGVWAANTFAGNQSAQITVGTLPTGGDWVGVTVRQSSNGSGGYLALWFANSGSPLFMLFGENGTSSPPLLTSVSGSMSAGDTLGISASGTTIVLYHNGTSLLSSTDSTYSSGAPGVAFYTSGSVPTSAVTLWQGNDTLAVTTASLPGGSTGTAYNQTLTASGGTSPYTWAVSSGSLPAGLSLSSGGVISGTPSASGLSSFTVRVTDASSNTATANLSINVTGSTLTILTSSLANIAQNVVVKRWLLASGGSTPYTWTVNSGSLPAGLALATDGTLSGTPTGTGTSSFVAQVTDAASATATVSLSITSVSAPFSPSSPTTDGNGVITWQINSTLNGNDAESIRVLQPTSPSSSYPAAFLFTLPVNSGTDDTTFGNGLDTVRALGLHNTYNLTVVEPSTLGCWLADNPTDTHIIQETYLLQLAAWARTTYGTTSERIYLIGFSRSGIAGQSLFFHHPDIYAAVASWDFPAVMSTYDGTDIDGTTGGNPAGTYGTQDNFAANYELSASNLAKWSAGQNFGTVNRIWIGGYVAFQDDVTAYAPILTTAGILHTTALVSASQHNWAPTPGWVAPALAAIITPRPPTTSLLLTGFP